MPRETCRLAIDLGTCNTVAVVRRGDDPPRALLFDGTPLLPSGVYATADGQILVGGDAERMLQIDPSRYEPYPKRRIDDTTVLLGETEIPVINLYAAILGRVAAEARCAGVNPTEPTVLTYPADWGPPRREILLSSARAAGFRDLTLVEEPVAAGTYCRSVLDQRIPRGQCLAVFDFGGGTLDVTVLRADEAGLSVLAVGGLDDLGGVDCDAALAGHLSQAIEWRDPMVSRRMNQPGTPQEQRDRQTFWKEVRAAKEMLSRVSTAPVRVPGLEQAMHLTREELERVVQPLVDRAVDETRRTLHRAGVITPGAGGKGKGDQGELAGIFLVGGASRMPIVASRLHARLRLAPSVPEQPELPVAYGALLMGRETPSDPTPPSPPPAEDIWPDSPPLIIPRPRVTKRSPRSIKLAPPPRRTRPKGKPALAGILLLASLLSGYLAMDTSDEKDKGSTGAKQAFGDAGGDALGSGPALKAVATIQVPSGSASAMTVTDDTLYYAVAGTETTDVFAVAVAGGAQRWKTTLKFASGTMSLATVGELLVVTALRVPSNDSNDVRAVLDTKTGLALWSKSWDDRLDVAYLGTDALVQRQIGTKTSLERVDLSTETSAGSGRRCPTCTSSTVGSPSRPTSRPPRHRSRVTPRRTLTWTRRSHRRSGSTRTSRWSWRRGEIGSQAVNTANGQDKASGAAPLQADNWTVLNGLAIGQRDDAETSVTAYRLFDLNPAWDYRIPAGASFERMGLRGAAGVHGSRAFRRLRIPRGHRRQRGLGEMALHL